MTKTPIEDDVSAAIREIRQFPHWRIDYGVMLNNGTAKQYVFVSDGLNYGSARASSLLEAARLAVAELRKEIT